MEHQMEFQYGTLTRLMTERNYFFIRDDYSAKDIFLHVSGFVGKVALPKGTRVRFHLAPNPRRSGSMMAIYVEPIPVPVASSSVGAQS
jgi:cold shock CspA family protein